MKKITLSSAAVVAVCGALSLGACQSSETAQPSKHAASGSVSGPAPAPASASASVPAPVAVSATSSVSSAAHDDDGYAYTHPCDPSQITLQLSPMTDVPTRRLITVHNNAATSCGLSYYPLVSLGDAKAADHSKDLRPLIPGGLGGPPAHVLHAGKTAYAVLDLNPGGSGSGSATTLDEIDVLASDSLPNAATKNFPLGGGSVGTPKLGLYEDAVADAVASMQGANTPQQ
jgi:hypothetical protein